MRRSSPGSSLRVPAETLEDMLLAAPQDKRELLTIALAWADLRPPSYSRELFGNHYDEGDPLDVLQSLEEMSIAALLLDAAGAEYDVEYRITPTAPGEYRIEFIRHMRAPEDERLEGEFYHYPPCCIEQYAEVRARGESPHAGYKEKLAGAQPPAYLLHVPCGIACPATQELVQLYRGFTRDRLPRFAQALEEQSRRDTVR